MLKDNEPIYEDNLDAMESPEKSFRYGVAGQGMQVANGDMGADEQKHQSPLHG